MTKDEIEYWREVFDDSLELHLTKERKALNKICDLAIKAVDQQNNP